MAITRRPAPAPSTPSADRATLRSLLGTRDFRRLLTVRLLSQLSDGVFQVSLASYVIFSPERQTSPTDIASMLAVLLLPFSVIGPFAGVLLDRWRRRQVLLVGNLARFGLGLATAALLLGRAPEWLFFASALLVTALNRFILAGLSAALPRVVAPTQLVTANALSPTAGTIAAAGGGGIGFVCHQVMAPGPDADAALVTVAAMLYLAAALAARRMAPELLGPEHHPDRPDLRAALGQAGHALLEGIRHLVKESRPALHALAAVTAARFCYGVLIVTVLMLSRYTFNNPADSQAGLATLGTALGLSALGFFLAAVVSPWFTRRLGLTGWMVACLGSAAVFVPGLGLFFTAGPAMAAALLLGVVTQGTKICADTIVQNAVEDDYRGRVFALYDVLFNVAFVAAAGVTALVLPLNGRSPGVVLGVAALYGLSAALYARRPG
ncbi:MFS family permease [Kitasatospora sp. GAS204A]|uniref:MFS transporter n=1 Tax=unclassified Kitasatospora TaxID=2633591 RepID=UPI002474502F|nr:MFS transporter [Kitasatospora sp. GAS204B]MDH6119683.1 MFS family permease [Kitasatospora sp. GAS204B]